MTYTIHRYPVHLIDVVSLSDGTRLTLRPVLPQDTELMQDYVRGLSREARYMRFMRGLLELPPGLLQEFTSIDYQAHMALIATVNAGGSERMVAEAHYAADAEDSQACEFAVSVADAWHGRGIARLLLERLTRDAAAAGFRRIVGRTLRENEAMRGLARRLGLEVERQSGDPTMLKLVKNVTARPDESPAFGEALNSA